MSVTLRCDQRVFARLMYFSLKTAVFVPFFLRILLRGNYCKWFINIISIFATLHICAFWQAKRVHRSHAIFSYFSIFTNFQFKYFFFFWQKKSALDSSYTYFVTFSQNSFYFVIYLAFKIMLLYTCSYFQNITLKI